MRKTVMTSNEIIQTIASEVVCRFGPWPTDLDIFVFRIACGWECLITQTDDPVASGYRAAALKIGKALEVVITLKE
ncbi:hypothetical protein AB7783_26630 [Tardiphaga sp. 172_B4_N1_3]|uniref:hypothetical protein n=1 Tax=Tardiphaga sp. 172_B4_N1_3 TaxID=3240787 RepID=UPI003F8894DD